MTKSSPATGGCLCGAVRYEIRGPVTSCGHCHCTLCRKASGAPVVTWVTMARSNFQVTEGALRRYRSSAHAERGFCERCGTPITFASEQEPGHLDVTVGSLDHPERFPPDHHIWTSSAISWLALDPALPAHAEGSSDGTTGD